LNAKPTVCEDWLHTISMQGELDAYTAPQLLDAVTGALEQGFVWLVVDLTRVEYIDSVGLGILIGGAKRAGERGGDLAVVSARRNVRKVFDVSGTAEMLNVVDDLPQASTRLDGLRQAREASPADAKGGEGL